MAAYLNDRVFDLGLTVLDTEADALHLCSQQPTTYEEVTTYSLANSTTFSIGAPEARSPNGRKVVVAAIDASNPGTVTVTGTASHYAIVDTANTRLLAAAPMNAPQALTAGNNFTTGAVDIGIPAPA